VLCANVPGPMLQLACRMGASAANDSSNALHRNARKGDARHSVAQRNVEPFR
jgi:hypothetical protein